MTGRLFGVAQGAGGAGGAGGRGEERARKEGRKEGEAEERGSEVTPLPEEKENPASAEVRSQRRGKRAVPTRQRKKDAGGKQKSGGRKEAE